MSLIEGVGDEVVHFAALALLACLAVAAWISTNARPDRYRTLLLMRSQATHPVTVSIRTGGPNLLYTNTSGNGSTDTVTVTSPGGEGAGGAGAVIPLQEMDSIVDADMALFDNNRLHFYRRVHPGSNARNENESSSESDPAEDSEPASNEQIREMDSIVSAMEADVVTPPNTNNATENDASAPTIAQVTTDKPDAPTDAPRGEGGAGRGSGDGKKILIRLKYLNDTLKEVEGSLDEPLKDFKWRHFRRELSSMSRVRLIHRGRVLSDEGASLRALGLTHRATVHALVHPQHAPRAHPAHPAHPAQTESGGATGRADRAPERGWDLENILMTLVSVALTVVWFFRCEYSNMFTASASVALFGLTVFYSVAIFGLYLTDAFQIDRRQPQPMPDN